MIQLVRLYTYIAIYLGLTLNFSVHLKYKSHAWNSVLLLSHFRLPRPPLEQAHEAEAGVKQAVVLEDDPVEGF